MSLFDDCPVNILQSEGEFSHLLEHYRALEPRRVLEIGSLLGGTLWYWLREAPEGARVAVIDTLVSTGDSRYAQQKAGHDHLWAEWADEFGHELTIIPWPSWQKRTRGALPFSEVDFLFIDADHRYESVKRDYEMYAPLVRPGGLIAFHDITERPRYGVHRFWRELKDAGHDTEEFIDDVKGGGIGMISVPEPEPRPFLSVVTRHMTSRPTLMGVNQESLAWQTDQDYEQIVIEDDEGRGLPWANRALATAEPLGEYVLILDDDNMIEVPEAIERLKEAASGNPDVVIFRGSHDRLGILPSDRVYQEKRPVLGQIDSADFIVRRDLWRKHIAAFGSDTCGDYNFLESLWTEDDLEVAWIEDVLTKAQQIGNGRPE